MEFEEDYLPEGGKHEYDIEIYSRTAVFWFTLIFTTLFGGTLLVLNLRGAGYTRRAIIVGVFSVAYYVVETFAATFIAKNYLLHLKAQDLLFALSVIKLAFDLTAALILVLVFYKRYFPEKDYYPKSVTAPLAVAFVLFVIYSIIGQGLMKH
ncbi:hypothetical protein [Mucilaginibacter ginkgonis]|uniref:Uncharacterized protein n=1 Tax=Mucilaginibacter ginkgonis TaxID=2682091 RepID=A0A6I4IN32_9SPHI|nr:hypothetical protein [Mucilaginibacter ginkgonis]QQL48256.1 hypothetical protein GO620_008585 [Mucilaginibacter ginkgonis]